jgi:hypothetical protein
MQLNLQEVFEMGFSTDYTEVQEFDLIPAGEYETIIKKIEERTTKNGATSINMTLVIRNDVKQGCQNRCIFHTLWKRHEPTQADMQVQGYSYKQIMRLAKAVNLPSGKNYDSVKQLCEDMIHRPLRITVEHELNEYSGKTRENVKYINESKYPDCKHIFKEKPVVSADTVAQRPQEQFAGSKAVTGVNPDDFEEIISDGDVPF